MKILSGLKKIFIWILDAYTPPKVIPPAADNNVMKITEDCLFMRTAWSGMYSGRRSMSWWASTGSVFVMCMMFSFSIASYIYETKHDIFSGTYFEFFLGGAYIEPLFGVLFALACSWMFIPWRRELPIIFNRKSKEVTFVLKDRVLKLDWEALNFSASSTSSVTGGGVPIHQGVLGLRYSEGDMFFIVPIQATEDVAGAELDRGRCGALMALAYIRLFMAEGAQALPPIQPSFKYRIESVREAINEFNPFPILYKINRWNFLFVIPYFLIAVPFALIAITGDIIYFYLDRILPRRKWPQELIDACDGVWNGQPD